MSRSTRVSRYDIGLHAEVAQLHRDLCEIYELAKADESPRVIAAYVDMALRAHVRRWRGKAVA